MTRLPTPGQDAGAWGQILNDYLSAAHKQDGTLKDNVVGSSQLQDNAVTNVVIADDSVTESNLSPEVVDKLNSAGVSSVATLTGDITSPDLVDALETDLQLRYAPVAGSNLTASGVDSWAEGRGTKANGYYTHAEGFFTRTLSSATAAHAEGYGTAANGEMSHAEGNETVAVGRVSHAEGYYTFAFRDFESARGYGGQVQQSFIPATSGAVNQTAVRYTLATGVITIPIHGGITRGKVTVMTEDGTISWDIVFSANNNATTYASRATGTVSILASVGTTATTYGSSAITWTVSGNATGQVIITPSAAPPARRVWCELLSLE